VSTATAGADSSGRSIACANFSCGRFSRLLGGGDFFRRRRLDRCRERWLDPGRRVDACCSLAPGEPENRQQQERRQRRTGCQAPYVRFHFGRRDW
jgi:hypothetical protein